MTARVRRALAALSALSSIAALAAFAFLPGCGDAVVGGSCAPGYAMCNGACQPLAACQDVGPDTFVDVGDGAPGDVGDGSADGYETDGMLPDGVACPDPPYVTNDHCGGCEIACGGTTPLCKGQGDPPVYGCVSPCEPGKTYCNGVCVDTDIDPYNCGGCGNFCPTGLCNGGKCRGAVPGHAVAIGHDYVGAAPLAAVSKVLVNAAFLPGRNPVRILGYQEYADAASVARVKAVLDGGTSMSGRTYALTPAATQAELLSKLTIDAFDVVLIYDQPNAPAGTLLGVGAAFAPDFASFSESGGVIVALDGASGVGEMPTFLAASGLLDTGAHTTVTSSELQVVAPADAVGIGVLSPYQAPTRSVTFGSLGAASATQVSVVVEPVSKAPVVIHRVVIKK
jgi:hypothetical protein